MAIAKDECAFVVRSVMIAGMAVIGAQLDRREHDADIETVERHRE
jgi:hypothetical protein